MLKRWGFSACAKTSHRNTQTDQTTCRMLMASQPPSSGLVLQRLTSGGAVCKSSNCKSACACTTHRNLLWEIPVHSGVRWCLYVSSMWHYTRQHWLNDNRNKSHWSLLSPSVSYTFVTLLKIFMDEIICGWPVWTATTMNIKPEQYKPIQYLTAHEVNNWRFICTCEVVGYSCLSLDWKTAMDSFCWLKQHIFFQNGWNQRQVKTGWGCCSRVVSCACDTPICSEAARGDVCMCDCIILLCAVYSMYHCAELHLTIWTWI